MPHYIDRLLSPLKHSIMLPVDAVAVNNRANCCFNIYPSQENGRACTAGASQIDVTAYDADTDSAKEMIELVLCIVI
jgi:hypothetical protein